MKSVTLMYGFIVLGCVYLRADSSPLSPKITEVPYEMCSSDKRYETLISNQHDDGCYEKRCHTDFNNKCVSILHRICPESTCYEGSLKYVEGNYSKPFPHCCGDYICREPPSA